MPDIKQVLGEEIRRLARKEVKQAVLPLQKTVAEQKQAIRDLKREIAELKKAVPMPEVPVQETACGENSGVKRRLNAAGIVRIRTKLKLSQSKFAALLGVAPHTVSMWEQGNASPRENMKRDICGLRSVGRRELKKSLETLCSAPVAVEAE
ncbi:MAG: helix-turn-helix domain-containing protein [Lentisphaeria bacterium]|nr:helix-turn-helix domain-containing protein [Lentisphaeria bacterium]